MSESEQLAIKKTVGIRELKTHLSQYITAVKAGETIIVTERGKPVGQLSPLTKDETPAVKVQTLRDAGLLIWNGEKLALDPVEPLQKQRDDVMVSDLVLEDRE